MGERRYTASQVDTAVKALSGAERFAHAQEIVTHAAPGLQRILGDALHAGGFFDAAHEGETARVAALADERERLAGVSTLVAEETRIGMLIGVAIGLELAEELQRPSGSSEAGGSSS